MLFLVDDALWRDGAIDIEALQPLARLSADRYGGPGPVFEISRPWNRSERVAGGDDE